MDITQKVKEYEDLGKQWLAGNDISDWSLNNRVIHLSSNQRKFLNSKERYCLYSGGYGCGKSLALLMKMVFFSLFFPDNFILLGRKTIQDIIQTILPDLFSLLPGAWFKYRVKDGIIEFFNGSKIILFALDSLQEGSIADIKKAQQKIKSLNLGAYFIDQMEEVEFEVFNSLNARLRRMQVPLRQGNATCNPANYWGYQFFKVNVEKRTDICLVEGSMFDNKDNLPADYLQDQLNHGKMYVKRYVEGIWSPDVLLANVVFPKEFIDKISGIERKPIFNEQGCDIYVLPREGAKYQLGVDPSEGSVDPSAISVINTSNGEKVASFNGFVPITSLAEKIKHLYFKYNKGLIIPEVNASGLALLEKIRDLNVYRRKTFDEKQKEETEKLGFKTSFQTKQALIDNFQNLIQKNFPKIYDHATIEEFKTFCWTDSAKQRGAGAQRGFHDDNVIATLLSFWGIKGELTREEILKEQIKRLDILKTKTIRGRRAFEYV